MYIPKAFAIDEATALDLIPRYPLATVIRTGSEEPDGRPHTVDPLHRRMRIGGQRAVLQGHVARNNPLAAGSGRRWCKVLVVFHGPAAYISPGWYASKHEDPRVVPTWNYAVVHVQGRLRAVDDHDWLTAHLTRLSTGPGSGSRHALADHGCTRRLHFAPEGAHRRYRDRDGARSPASSKPVRISREKTG